MRESVSLTQISAKLLVLAVRPDDVPAGGAVCEERFQNRARIASLEALDEAIGERGGGTVGGHVTVRLSNVVLRSCLDANTLSRLVARTQCADGLRKRIAP